eukprot:1157193-Amphidinium_carterae.1
MNKDLRSVENHRYAPLEIALNIEKEENNLAATLSCKQQAATTGIEFVFYRYQRAEQRCPDERLEIVVVPFVIHDAIRSSLNVLPLLVEEVAVEEEMTQGYVHENSFYSFGPGPDNRRIEVGWLVEEIPQKHLSHQGLEEVDEVEMISQHRAVDGGQRKREAPVECGIDRNKKPRPDFQRPILGRGCACGNHYRI